MKIFFGQIYVDPGVKFTFTHRFQKFIGGEISSIVKPSDKFINEYGEDFDLIFRVSAKRDITDVDIKGPTVFKKDKDVEFTIFLPFDSDQPSLRDGNRRPLELLLGAVVGVLNKLEIDTKFLQERMGVFMDAVMADPSMI